MIIRPCNAGEVHLMPQLLRIFPHWAPWCSLATHALPRALWWLHSCSLACQLAAALFPDRFVSAFAAGCWA